MIQIVKHLGQLVMLFLEHVLVALMKEEDAGILDPFVINSVDCVLKEVWHEYQNAAIWKLENLKKKKYF